MTTANSPAGLYVVPEPPENHHAVDAHQLHIGPPQSL
jgi:hypothetical protein